jgi:hypothetical protein
VKENPKEEKLRRGTGGEQIQPICAPSRIHTRRKALKADCSRLASRATRTGTER